MADMTVQSRRLSVVRYHVCSVQLGSLPFKAIQGPAGANHGFQIGAAAQAAPIANADKSRPENCWELCTCA